MTRIAIIGGGTAGFFCAALLSRDLPSSKVTIFEAGKRPMVKLGLTGGGRCNISNTFESVTDLRQVYPRGASLMKRLLKEFGLTETRKAFAAMGIEFEEEDAGRLFPASRDASQVVRALLSCARRSGVELRCADAVVAVQESATRFTVRTASGTEELFDAVVVASGGCSSRGGLSFLEPLDIALVEPVPSLFTLRIKDSSLNSLTGISVPEAVVAIPGTSLRATGALLITDWGLSGPCVLRLSSYAARELHAASYRTPLMINWISFNEQEARPAIAACAAREPQKMIANSCPFALPSRLWEHLLSRAGLRSDMRWAELGSKGLSKLVSVLVSDVYKVLGKGAFKEEFVTCGGVSLSEVDSKTLGSRSHPGLYFAGEALDIDAVTGGFNLQAAWTTGAICARSIALSFSGE